MEDKRESMIRYTAEVVDKNNRGAICTALILKKACDEAKRIAAKAGIKVHKEVWKVWAGKEVIIEMPFVSGKKLYMLEDVKVVEAKDDVWFDVRLHGNVMRIYPFAKPPKGRTYMLKEAEQYAPEEIAQMIAVRELLYRHYDEAEVRLDGKKIKIVSYEH